MRQAVSFANGGFGGGEGPLARFSLTSEWIGTEGITPDYATVDPDLSAWSASGDIVVGGSPSGYTLDAIVGGTSTRAVTVFPTSLATPHGCVVQFRVMAGVNDWARIRFELGVVEVWVNVSTGVVGTDAGTYSPGITIADLGSGVFEITVEVPITTTNGRWQIYPAVNDGLVSSTAAAGQTIMTVWDVEPNIQVRCNTIADRKPAAVDLGQSDITKQPLVVSGGLRFDGDTDRLDSNITLSELTKYHRDATLAFALEVLNTPPANSYMLGTTNVVSTKFGFTLYTPGGDDVRLRVMNGSGTYWYNVASAAGALGVGKHAIVASYNATGCSLFVDGVKTTDTPNGSSSPTDPSEQLFIHRAAGGTYPWFDFKHGGMIDGALSDADSLNLCQTLMALYGV